jgi:hypothetical protein
MVLAVLQAEEHFNEHTLWLIFNIFFLLYLIKKMKSFGKFCQKLNDLFEFIALSEKIGIFLSKVFLS